MTTAAPAWTVYLCRSNPEARDIASVVISRGAAVTWCGPECCPAADDEATPEFRAQAESFMEQNEELLHRLAYDGEDADGGG
jgi:hypothetical protein